MEMAKDEIYEKGNRSNHISCSQPSPISKLDQAHD